ncbi:MAG: hypothetical protein LBI67_06840 [Treponema sp.]|nr:hypothetical protein [Treponema sp.]
MKVKKIIPRRDHEVYFILVSPELKGKEIRPLVLDRLGELHPGFSATVIFDIQTFIFNKRRWVMATVMEDETLAEYKILNKGAIFYTNTSIMANKKGFVGGNVTVVGDERIGFDNEKDEPVSVPLETEKNADTPYSDSELRHIPARHGVFNKKTPKALLVACIAMTIVLLLSPFIVSRTNQPDDNIQPTGYETVPEMNYMPTAISILSVVSEKTLEGGGEIIRWQYNESTDQLMVLQLKGIETLSVHAVFNSLDYLILQDIQDITYADGAPYFTVFINPKSDTYVIPSSTAFPAQISTLKIITDLTDTFRRQEIAIVSEVLPTSGNGNSFYTLTYTAEDWNFIRSLEILESVCDAGTLRIKSLDISISSDKTLFTVRCTLSHCNTVDVFASPGSEKYIIPIAFGYMNGIPFIEPSDVLTVEPSIIGSIRDSSGKTVYYRDIDGKIRSRGE